MVVVVAVMAVIIKVVVVIVMAVIMAVIIAAAVVMAPGKGSGKNPEKCSPRRKGKFPSGFLIQDGVRVGVISIPINILPA